MKDKAVPGLQAHQFHWTMEGIRREVEPTPPTPPKSSPRPPTEEEALKETDQRRYPRIDLTLPVLYKILPEEPLVASQAALPDRPTQADNISSTGAGLVLAEKLPRGTVLALSLHVADQGTISAVGRVVWSRATETAHHYLTGLEFVVVYRKTRIKTEYLNIRTLNDLLGLA